MVLVPVLIHLGDEPPAAASCDWAVVLQRPDVSAWLNDAADGLRDVPVCVSAYLDLFRAMDLALELRRSHRAAVEAVRTSGATAPEWRLLEPWLVDGDRSFFEEVLAEPELRRLVQERGLTCGTYGAILGRNDGLQGGRACWRFPEPAGAAETVEVLFEARRRGRLKLLVTVSPYEGSIGRRPERRRALSRQLARKTAVIEALRARFRADPALTAATRARPYGQADQPSRLTALEFRSELTPNCSVQACAAEFARIIGRVSTVVDEIVGEFTVQGW